MTKIPHAKFYAKSKSYNTFNMDILQFKIEFLMRHWSQFNYFSKSKLKHTFHKIFVNKKHSDAYHDFAKQAIHQISRNVKRIWSRIVENWQKSKTADCNITMGRQKWKLWSIFLLTADFVICWLVRQCGKYCGLTCGKSIDFLVDSFIKIVLT